MGITKRFGPVLANQSVDLTLMGGEVHAILGENGAGKTTLMSILAGLLRPDSGEVRVDGTPLPAGSPRAALAAGIWLVHQHFMLVGPLTVEDNLRLAFAGSRQELRRRVAEAQEMYGLAVDLQARVDDLSVGARQRVELLKGILQDARCLVLDEPTAVLAEREISGLLGLLRTLAGQGRAVALITHKVAEVLSCANRVTVLRGGGVAGRFDPARVTTDELVAAVVGGSLPAPDRSGRQPGAAVLTVIDAGESFGVGRCEVFGVAGVDGNGQVELAEEIVGLRQGRPIVRSGSVGYIPQDRMRDGLAGPLSVAENLWLRRLAGAPGTLLPTRREMLRQAEAAIAAYDIRPALPLQPVERLSGGNQQKVVLARELGEARDLLVAVQPTRGLDPGATAFVQQRILAAAASGMAVVYVSTDLDELIQLADRIAVMYRGRVVGVAARENGGFPRERIGAWMTGVES